ncbi:MAG: HDIG domain-containing protein [candidate division Zixibacteria bacterium]|nr:HDIG domain-containing protein [candidate division Zixibacteria bacterium]
MRKLLLKIKRSIKRIFKVKQEIDMVTARRRSRILVKYAMGVAAIVLITLLYPLNNMRGPLDIPIEGEIAYENIIADFSFNILKDRAQVDEEIHLALQSTPLFINYNSSIVDSSRNRLRRLLTAIDSIKQISHQQTIDSTLHALSIDYPMITPYWLHLLTNVDSLDKMNATLDTILTDSIYYYGVIPSLSTLPPADFKSIIMKKQGRDMLMIRPQLSDIARAYSKLLETLTRIGGLTDKDVEIYYEIGRHFIIPNASYNDIITQAARDSVVLLISNVEKRVTGGDLIVRRGTRVDAAKARLINAYADELQKAAAAQGWFAGSMPVFGRLILIAFIVALLYLFFFHFRPDVYWSNNKMLAILLIIALELFLVNFIGVRLAYSVYLYPIAILSILITVLFDSRLGVVVTLLVALLLGILNRFNFSITLITAIAGSIACFSAGEVRRRSEFYRIIIALSMTYAIIIFVIESLKLSPAGDVLTYCGYGLANGFLAPILTIGILPMFESLFGFSTNITLLELADLNQPLLKRMAVEAPGTYHHSIVVGNLGEAAAKAIDANPLLARVGAYYHDIGKMEIPEYFVENQLGIKSKHESLNPTMSALVLASHVKKGRRIGEMEGLPDAILNFIEEHHGTTRMSYFYNKAKEMDLPVDTDGEFRYPGPKPQTKETAIIMLADSTEAASRTLDKPTPARIRNLIQRLINDKFTSGELTECDLTLKDLSDIREAFVSILIGVFHQRIPYPKKDDEETVNGRQ